LAIVADALNDELEGLTGAMRQDEVEHVISRIVDKLTADENENAI